MLTIRNDDDSINVTFIPDNFTLKHLDLLPNNMIFKLLNSSRPYELHFSQFGKNTVPFFNFFFVDHSSMQLPLLVRR